LQAEERAVSTFDLVSGLIDGAFKLAVVAVVLFPAYLVWCFVQGRRATARKSLEGTVEEAPVSRNDPSVGEQRTKNLRRLALTVAVLSWGGLGVASLASADEGTDCAEYRAALVRAVSNPLASIEVTGLDAGDTEQIEDSRATFQNEIMRNQLTWTNPRFANQASLESWDEFAAGFIKDSYADKGCD
jgi:hypothetical protein